MGASRSRDTRKRRFVEEEEILGGEWDGRGGVDLTMTTVNGERFEYPKKPPKIPVKDGIPVLERRLV